jgi:hypothetical protein
MFRTSFRALRDWIERADLLGDPEPTSAPHPHRHELRWQPIRRHGAVAARPAVCISPVRAARDERRRDTTRA